MPLLAAMNGATGRAAPTPRPVAHQVVIAVLTIRCGTRTRHGDWLIQPTADYWCACGWTDTASGPGPVAVFAGRAATDHHPDCPLRKDTP